MISYFNKLICYKYIWDVQLYSMKFPNQLVCEREPDISQKQ